MNSQDPTIEFYSTITCPECEHCVKEKMPTDACAFFWKCPSCETVVRPEVGDCCVYCSYGTHACPPVQQSGSSCC